MQAPPVHLTDKTRELLRLLAADPVMAHALYFAADGNDNPVYAMLSVSRMDDAEWQNLEDKFRGTS